MRAPIQGILISATGIATLLLLFLWLRPAPDYGDKVIESEGVYDHIPGPASTPDALPAEPGVAAPLPLVRVEGGRRVAGPAQLRVLQGERVRLRFVADEAGELHLHGYDLALALPAGQEVELAFDAELSGRFEYELHGHHGGAHAALGVIEVHPR